MPRTLIATGLILLFAGLCWPLLSRLPLGRLPGDILIQRQNFTFYLPITTCVLASIIFSFIAWIVRR
ncbi:DUF2905 domain-containing protein [Komagataeibacter europaeus]|uniref:DUF2905 domain-containing protein n=1 Tax=Komagataeibacter europaeus TaxID=33995 RepID=UPI000B3EDC8B|nr:DUF2905 domain-containing protein [Komagataeibacter europaeus]ARW15392.1 hypothetical protein S101446_00251 [Komagataeibacter europaeus]